jgi:alpha-L-fucosidase
VAEIPSYLKAYEDEYAQDPRAAAIEWFRNAKYGLFLHYGLYSLLGRHEWVQLREKIPVAEYAKLKDQFTAEEFDADYIAAFAQDCGMRYINITTRHHDSFCLWDTKQTDFSSVNSPAKRDLLAELAEACATRGLGLFFYYSHGRDWKHPHAPNNDEWGGSARPGYDPPEPSYAYGEEHHLQIYLDFMTAQIKQLLTNYGPIAGIWLDGIAVPRSGDVGKLRCQELYDLIHDMQPQVLVSYKQGLLGTEDFSAPEHRVPEKGDARQEGQVHAKPDRPLEICTTMIGPPVSWGYLEDPDVPHKTADGIWEALREARQANANLLLNTGPRGDGSLDPRDEPQMREVGPRLRAGGFPV